MVAAAVIGGVATIGSAVASTSASNKAAKTAQTTAAANNALESQIYGQNKAALQPYEDRGNAAGSAINALLGLGGGSSSGAAPTVDWGAYVRGNPDALADYERYHSGQDINDYGQFHYAADGSKRDLTPYTSGGTSAAAGQGAASAASAAFDAYKASTEYTSRLKQGQDTVTAALGGKGLLDSGAALKSLTNYGQTAASAEFGNYLGNLQAQQAAGLTATSAQAGLGTTYAGAVSNNNNISANTTSNAALSNASTISSALGNLVTGYSYSQGLGSSYAGKPSAAAVASADAWRKVI